MGLEPTTCALRKHCSTTELGWQYRPTMIPPRPASPRRSSRAGHLQGIYHIKLNVAVLGLSRTLLGLISCAARSRINIIKWRVARWRNPHPRHAILNDQVNRLT